MTSSAPDCERPAKRRNLCDGHRWQLEHRRPFTPLEPRQQTGQQRLEAAALAYAAAETPLDFARAIARLRTAAVDYVQARPRCTREGCDRRRHGDGLCHAHRREAA